MKIWRITGALAALLTVLAISAIACSGDDDDDDGGGSVSEIRTQKGLTVANVDQFGGGTNAESADGDDASIGEGAAPAAPAVDVGFGGDEVIGRLGGGFAPDALQQTGSGGGLTVQGYGTATADADSARVEFYFGRYTEGEIRFDEPVPPDAGSGSSGSDGDDIAEGAQPGAAEPITEAELQSVIDALESAGADEVEFVEQPYYDAYWASATLRATVSDLETLDGIVDAGNSAAANLGDISLQSSNVMYTVSDCSALQQAALATAIEDAGDNAQTFAAALGVTAGEMIGASNLSWYPNDGSGCDSYWGYYPVEDIGFVGGPAEVSAYAQVAITYAMQ